MNLQQLKELQELSYEWAKYAGFDRLNDIETRIALNKEIAEAWESRGSFFSETEAYLSFMFKNKPSLSDNYHKNIQDTFESELADIFIILVRIIPLYNIKNYPWFKYGVDNIELAFDVYQESWFFRYCLEYNNLFKPLGILYALVYFCKQSDIDLYSHVKLKLKYNYTREEYKK